MTSRKAPAAISLALLLAIPSLPAAADEGGVGFWLPGQFGSMAATPQTPGLTLATIYYHTSLQAGGSVTASREITIGQFTPTLTATLEGQLDARADMAMLVPSYVFSTPFLGGQAAVSLTGLYGHTSTEIDATLTGTLGPLAFSRSADFSDATSGFGDLYPQFSLRWNNGVHNYMAYVTGDVPIGKYNSERLANLGLGHGALDAGAGYTYFNPKSGLEFSAVLGSTYNFENTSTDYQNGVDLHLDWGASQFVGERFHFGFVGYAYEQITDDSGAGAQLGAFKSRVFGIGPQAGFLFPVGDMQGYLNLKGYQEFGAENRPEGWNVWLTFAISPAAPSATSSKP
ncbi:MAG: SphA family protein [Dongiaceae bacterium]